MTTFERKRYQRMSDFTVFDASAHHRGGPDSNEQTTWTAAFASEEGMPF